MSDGELDVELDLDAALEVAEAAARAAGEVLVRYFRDPELVVELKEDGTVVSRADREAEDLIRTRLAGAAGFEGLDILGEERGGGPRRSRLRWIVDPLDGTFSFTRGVPLFGTLVALEDSETGETLVGVTHLPKLDETYTAARGRGCRLDGKPTRIRQDADLRSSLISVGDPIQYDLAICRGSLYRLMDACDHVRGYTDCFGHAMLLRGSLGALFDTIYNPWDVAAFRVQVPEAGGKLLLRRSGYARTVDVLAGSAGLVDALADLVEFEPDEVLEPRGEGTA